MELTIEQALQQAIEAHRAGKLQVADALYRAILRAQPGHPDANHNLGVLEVSLNNSEAALPLFKTALEANPNHGQFWLSYIDTLIKEKQLGNAKQVLELGRKRGLAGEKVDALERLLVDSDTDPAAGASRTARLLPALELREAGRYQEAEEWLSRFLATEPRDAEAWSLLSYVYLLDRKDAESGNALSTAASIAPDLPSVHRNQARLLLRQSKPAEALERAQSGYERSPDDPESWLVLASCLGAIRKDQEALHLIEKALLARPDYAEAFASRSLVRLRANDVPGAINDIEMAVSLKPHLAQMWGLLGTLRYQAKNLSGAIEALEKAHELEPANVRYMVDLGEFLRQAKRMVEAIAILEAATRLAPDNASAWTNLGTALQEAGEIGDAKAAYEKALAINPESAEISNNLGAIEKEAENWESALKHFERALQIKPDFAEAHNGLGSMLKALGRSEDAEASYRRALALKPDFAEAHNNLGLAIQKRGRLEDAEASFRKAIELKPDFAGAHSNLAASLLDQKRLKAALVHFRIALDRSPNLVNAQSGIAHTLSKLVPPWHVPMMNEAKRNSAYYAALESLVKPDSSVFEIGTGSGLLSMMAARLGANTVTTCESELIIAETAQKIINDNGYGEKIRLIPKKSTKVVLGEDLPRKPDILVTETFSSELLGEGVLPSIEDAKRRLLSPGARIIPAAGSVMVALFGGEDIEKNLFVQDCFGFRLERFNSIVTRKISISRDDLAIELFTDPIEAFRFEFEADSSFPSEARKLRIPIHSPGRCLGVIQWIRLEMTKEIVFENHPFERSTVSNWQRCAYLFPEPVEIRSGEIAVISASHDRNNPWFSLEAINGSANG